jgi:hypothetical protein
MLKIYNIDKIFCKLHQLNLPAMLAILLSGVGGSSNWLPLIFPLAAIVIIAKSVELLIHFIRKRRLHHINRQVNGLSFPSGDENGQGDHEI